MQPGPMSAVQKQPSSDSQRGGVAAQELLHDEACLPPSRAAFAVDRSLGCAMPRLGTLAQIMGWPACHLAM